MKTSPSTGSYSLSMRLTVVLFPHPDSPTSATFLPGSNSKLSPSRMTLLFSSEGYMNLIFLNSIFPLTSSLGGFFVACETSI